MMTIMMFNNDNSNSTNANTHTSTNSNAAYLSAAQFLGSGSSELFVLHRLVNHYIYIYIYIYII